MALHWLLRIPDSWADDCCYPGHAMRGPRRQVSSPGIFPKPELPEDILSRNSRKRDSKPAATPAAPGGASYPEEFRIFFRIATKPELAEDLPAGNPTLPYSRPRPIARCRATWRGPRRSRGRLLCWEKACDDRLACEFLVSGILSPRFPQSLIWVKDFSMNLTFFRKGIHWATRDPRASASHSHRPATPKQRRARSGSMRGCARLLHCARVWVGRAAHRAFARIRC